MGKFIRLNHTHQNDYIKYINKYFYENLYLCLDFNLELDNSTSEKKNGDYYGYYLNDKLEGCFVFSNNKILHMSYQNEGVLKKLDLIRAIKHYKPKIIKGNKKFLMNLVNILRKSIVSLNVNDYYIMENEFRNKNFFSMDKKKLDNNLTKKIIDNSFQFLINVEKSFKRNPKLINRINKKIYKKYNLNEYVSIIHEGRIIAQGMLENIGEEYIVIGSIFVDPKFRNNGYGEFIIKTLVMEILKRNKKPILLVKKTNDAAIELYKKCKFIIKSNFTILEVKFK